MAQLAKEVKLVNNFDDSHFYRGTSDFNRVIKQKSFTDKTSLIKLVPLNQVTFLQAPSRFGKSTAISMLKRFFEIEVSPDGEIKKNKRDFANYKLFTEKPMHLKKQLAICEDKTFFDQFFGEYPVVHLDFSRISIDLRNISSDHIANSLGFMLKDLFDDHSYLLDSNRIHEEHKKQFKYYMHKEEVREMAEIGRMLKILFRCISVHFGKNPIILIDEFDTPIAKFILGVKNFGEEMIDTFSECFGEFIGWLLKTNIYFSFAFLTGITRYGGIYTWAANNINHISIFLDETYAPYFGLTLNEVLELTERYKQTDMFDKIKEHYDGYRVNNSSLCLFSMISVIKSLETKHIEPFWIESGFVKTLIRVFRFENLGASIWDVLRGKRVKTLIWEKLDGRKIVLIRNLIKALPHEINEDDGSVLLQYFFENGFLTLAKDFSKKDTELEVILPNKEVSSTFEKMFWLAATQKYKTLPQRLREFAEALEDLNETDTSCQNLTDKTESLVKTLGRGAIEGELQSYLFVGLRIEIEKMSSEKRGDKNTRTEIRVGDWSYPLKDKDELTPEEQRGRVDLIFWQKNVSEGAVETWTAKILEIKHGQESAQEALKQILDTKYKRAFTEDNERVGKPNVTKYVYIGLHATKTKFKVTSSILFDDEDLAKAIKKESKGE